MAKGTTFAYGDLSKKSNWNFYPDSDKTGADSKSFVNQSLNELWWMHLIASVLLFGAMISVKRSTGTVFSLGSVFKIITIPIYLAVLYRAEQAIRKYRTVYSAGSSPKNFTFGTWRDPTIKKGSTCFFSHNGSAL